MTVPRHARPAPFPPGQVTSTARRHLADLATAMTPYGLWARVIDDAQPFLRVSNPASKYAEEDVVCVRRSHGYSFATTFDLDLGPTHDIDSAAWRLAWLLGAEGTQR
ncbi:hypothetical protein [Allonocardiopsis opalescens]|uniref:Uncharacterized protein n=1 Tax=Allonocardiopsis opalescens TaxID=1144618 RepID=A0A2T0QCC0_9ACTN|nr:hypothetical protein [Allonocardiopsis opalescens]PRY01555.1 hypothetical protein CLV72_101138 [Allonocardiopsis opalescens]